MTPEQTKLIESHQGLVRNIVAYYLRKSGNDVLLNEDEILLEANLGLVKAALSYNSSKNLKFRSYACVRVRGHIRDYLRSRDPLSRRARKQKQKTPEPEVTVRSRNDFPFVEGCLCEFNTTYNQPIYTQYHENTPEKRLCRLEIRRLVRQVAKTKKVSRRDYNALTSTYLGNNTVSEVATSLGLNQSRVSQINVKNIALLRTALKTQGITATHQLLL